MPGAPFHETKLGERFYAFTLPRIADELVTLNDNLRALVSVLRDRLAAPTTTTTTTTAPPERG